MTAANEADLQRFFESNPAYFEIVLGHPPGPSEAHEAMHEPLPDGWRFDEHIFLGWREASGHLAAMAHVTSGLFAPSIWQIALFILSTARHGRGEAQVLYRELETWMAGNGAEWVRLGVVAGNARAERFWEACGFREVRRRNDVPVGDLRHTLRVMMKPLKGGSIEAYLQMVQRDRPDAP